MHATRGGTADQWSHWTGWRLPMHVSAGAGHTASSNVETASRRAEAGQCCSSPSATQLVRQRNVVLARRRGHVASERIWTARGSLGGSGRAGGQPTPVASGAVLCRFPLCLRARSASQNVPKPQRLTMPACFARRPAATFREVELTKDFKRVAKCISKMSSCRSDLKNTALTRWYKINKSQKKQKK